MALWQFFQLWLNKNQADYYIDSVAGHVVYPDSAVYCGTKFAVRQLWKTHKNKERITLNQRLFLTQEGTNRTLIKQFLIDSS